jgi:demethylmenaquinone methyltransferase/2-methoxy-6-polyprenyl-1,4-benzoquinol methylase
MKKDSEEVLDKQNKEEKVYRTFEAIAKQYDRMNDLISFGQHRKWKKDVVDSLSGNNQKGILDVCCGTGDLTRLLAVKYSPIKITGLDYSPAMLEVAENNRQKAGLDNIDFIQGNAMALPFEDNSFSHSVISFGLRNCRDYGKVIKEMRRVTAPGGLVVCLETLIRNH